MPFCLRNKLAGEAPICPLEILSLNAFQRKKNDGKLSKELFTENLVLGNLQPFKPCLLPRSVESDCEEGMQSIHEKRLAEPARPRNDINGMPRLHHRLDVGRLVDVIVLVLDQRDEGRIADCNRLFHDPRHDLKYVIFESITSLFAPDCPARLLSPHSPKLSNAVLKQLHSYSFRGTKSKL